MIHVSVKELNAVTERIAAYAGEQVARQLAAFDGQSVCSGIHNNAELQKRARINHYGGSGTRTTTVKRWEESRTAGGRKRLRYRKVKMTIPYNIPPRHFIDYAVSNGMTGTANRNIISYIQESLKGRGRISSYNGQQYTSQRESFFKKGMGVDRFFGGLGKLMLDNQKNALVNTAPNAPSTVKRKGANTPMRDTYELYNGLEYWYERKK
jgi:hypothetical protein